MQGNLRMNISLQEVLIGNWIKLQKNTYLIVVNFLFLDLMIELSLL